MAIFSVHGGARLRTREMGARHGGVPVVLVHGAGMASGAWLPVMYRLARRHHVIAVDLPGHGRSSGHAPTLEALRDGLGLAAATLCLPPSILVGHSLGGLVVLAAALAWPDKVRGVALVTSAAHLPIGGEQLARARRLAVEWPRELARSAYAPRVDAERRRRGALLAALARPEQTAADHAILAATDLRPRLGEVRAPSLVVSAVDDPLVPLAATTETATALGARHVRVPGGHMPMHEAPEALASALSQFTGSL